jgi:RHS repeat-associated protein
MPMSMRTTASGSDVFTAFGERQAGSSDRFGYVGAFGYQSHSIPESPNPDTAFPFLHVGARYYDPASGRFLQRDPIGIRGGTNVYLYVSGAPTADVDPLGLQPSSVNPVTAAGAGLTEEDLANLLGCALAAKAAKDTRPRLGDRVDGTPTYSNPKYPRIGRDPNKPKPPKGDGHPASYPLAAMLVIFLAYAGTQVFHRRSLGKSAGASKPRRRWPC